jgi:2-oxoisovalerate dehydrogenase E1 component
LITEISKSCYLSEGKFPVNNIIRVPIGAYGGGGPYHSGSVESILANIKGIKVAYRAMRISKDCLKQHFMIQTGNYA